MKKGTGIVRLCGDWASLVHAIHRPVSSDRGWAEAVLDAAASVLPTVALSLVVVEHSPDCTTWRTANSVLSGALAGAGNASSFVIDGGAGIEVAREYFYPPYPVTTHLEVERALAPKGASFVRDLRARMGAVDSVGILAHPEPGVVAVLSGLSTEPVALTRYERGLLTRIGLHLEASIRLQRRPEIVKAEILPDGRVIHRFGDAPSGRALSDHTSRITRARSKRGAKPSVTLDLWPALLSGHLSLVERGEGPDRRYLVVENAPTAQPMRALDLGELTVLAQAARGLPIKLIAYALGLSPATVSGRLASATSKLGAASRLELLRIAAILTRDPRASCIGEPLTLAERDVLELVQRGISNDEIARMRSRSVRTIANQVASLLRKTESSSRRALIVRPTA